MNNIAAEDEKGFKKFLTSHGVKISIGENGEYSFLNRLIYSEWKKSPELGLQKIQKLRTTTIKPH